ncbi:MAG TPA: Gfo/Idh/MocA family oxidoreductase [Planctomycetota bacterium]|nr:Gfo/Idh/MocA family oxidoreductase [Planctomycetota bacterium]
MTTTRRNLLKTLAASAAAPFIFPARAWAAGEKRSIGCVGMGKQMRGLMNGFMSRGVQVLGVCDPDTTRRTDAQAKADKYYTDNPSKGSKGTIAYNDYRELIARKDIDLICIATPDHWHARIIIEAVKASKDVYCEKPLTHDIQESIDVMKAVEENKRVLQTGSMQRSSKEFRIACELVQNGVIGKIERVECSFGDPFRPCDLPEEKAEPGLDWNLWLGPAPVRPYNAILSPRGIHDNFPNWRSYEEYGGGGVADWGAHHLDIAQWGLGMDNSGPVEVLPPEKTGDKRGAVLKYASGVSVIHKDGYGVHFYGADGEVLVNRGKFKLIVKGETIADHTPPPPPPKDKKDAPAKDAKAAKETAKTSLDAELKKAEEAFLKNAKIKLYVSKSHHDDFLECVASRKKPITSEITGSRSAICCHLLNLAYKYGKPMKWDPEKNAFAAGTGDPKWLTLDTRDPFKKG